jgi:asparagine synthase (glutamine-hydrolysing)
MCGIAGLIRYGADATSDDARTVERMLGRLVHRGPDAGAVYREGSIVLGHRRLAIVDLSETGAQPMRSGIRTALVYNGEAYNHAALRDLPALNSENWRGHSDTETVLRLLDTRGPDALRDVAGIFALAYWSERDQSLTLARDPLGVKQLYVYERPEFVAFASELKALFEVPGFRAQLEPEAVNDYLHFHGPLFERTFFRGVRQLLPGQWMSFGRNGRRREKTYWFVPDQSPRTEPHRVIADELLSVLAEVVHDQLMADVPVGCFFSGGIDSSSIAKIGGQARPLKLFGVHFSGEASIDERPFQEAAARSLGLDLELTTLASDALPNLLPRLLYFQDQPVVGTAILPMFAVSKLASQSVKVCLGGQAADELFAGYARYNLVEPGRAALAWWSGRQPRHDAARGSQGSRNLWKQLADRRNLERLTLALRAGWSWKRRYLQHFRAVPEGVWLDSGISPELFSEERAYQSLSDFVDRSPASAPTEKVLHWESATYLTQLFQQDDRMSMANSLESRVPFADPRLVRFAMRVPLAFKLSGGSSKRILRDALEGTLPSEIIHRRKAGFDNPVLSWMRREQRDWTQSILRESRTRTRGYFSTAFLESILESDRSPWSNDVLWKVISLELWSRTFLDETPTHV